MTRYLIGALLVLIAGYGFLKAWPLIAGPAIALASPTPFESVPGGIVSVSGSAARIAMLTLDGSPLLHDQNGSFSTTLTLPRGTSILTIAATDRFGRTTHVTRSVFVPN